MKHTTMKTIRTAVTESVVCDVTGEICPSHDIFKNNAPEFDHAELSYSGCFGSKYDELSFTLDLHPDLAVALYQLTADGKKYTEEYELPKFKIIIEEQK